MFFGGLGFAVIAALAAATQCPMDYARHVDPATDTALFVSCMMFWEGRILDAAYWEEQGLTRDGCFVYPNGALGPPHLFSAPSKESLHLGVLARALSGDLGALTFVVARRCDETGSLETCQALAGRSGRSEAMDQLERKVAALERFNKEFPGYGGFLPWFTVNASGSLVPLGGWEQRIPALDNGEMIWGLIAAAEALTDDKSGLGARVEALIAVLATNAKAAFYEGMGRVRAVSRVVNPNAQQPTASNFASDGAGYLVDPYEGELFTQFLCLFGAGVTAEEAEPMWVVKRLMLREVTVSGGSVQRGWWFSSHEQWKYLFAPYRDVAINWQLFVNGEMARTQHSRALGIGGLFASVNNVTLPWARFSPAYYSANGVSELAFQASDCCGTTVTPYASFSVMLANQTAGLAWWASVASASRLQSRFGSLESVLTDGSLYCPLVTWDAKVTSVLAALGGAVDLCRSYLQRRGVYDAFANRVQHEWSLAFPNVSSGGLSFALPNAPMK
jgi:hypothetical protein